MTEEEKQSSESVKEEAPLAQFALLYESKDGKLCLFEDAEGHLTAVRSDKLA